jgi:ABC-type uncharacterized transport system auxiliary subunit
MQNRNNNIAKEPFVFIMMLLIVNGCISLKSEYPAINYYQLTQRDLTTKEIEDKLDGVLLIRDFQSNRQYSGDQLFVVSNDNELEYYYYHRWAGNITEMITDFTFTRLLQYNFFNGGVIRSSTILSPDYYLEGNIIEMAVYNRKSEGDSSLVSMTINFILSRRISQYSAQLVALNKLYSSRVSLPSNNVRDFAGAYSMALSRLCDSLFKDIYSILKMQ